MALGFGTLGWLLADRLTPLLLGHTHHDARGAHYRHVDGHEGTVLALAMAAVLSAVAWAITLAVTAGPRSDLARPRRSTRHWAAATPAALFVTLQTPTTDLPCLATALVGAGVHAAFGATALALARRCTHEIAGCFGVPDRPVQPCARSRVLAGSVLDLARTFPARSGSATRAPPALPAR